MPPLRERASAATVFLVLGVALLLSIPWTATASGNASPASSRSASTASAPTSGRSLLASAPRSGGEPASRAMLGGNLSTEYTLFVRNGSLFSGNRLPSPVFDPYHVAYVPSLNELFVTSSRGLLRLDPGTLTVLGNESAVPSAAGVGFDPASGDLLLATPGNVSVFDPATGSVVALVHASQAGQTVDGVFAFDPVANVVVVGGELNSSANVVNLTQGRVVANVTLGFHDVSGVFDPVNSRVYVADYENNSLLVISTQTWKVVQQIALPASLFGFAEGVGVDPETGNVYLTSAFYCPGCFGTDYLVEISGATGALLANTSLPGFMTGMAFDPVADLLFVGDSAHNRLYVVDPSNLTLVATASVPGSTPFLLPDWWLSYVPQLNAVVVPSSYGSRLSLVSAENFSTVATVSSDSSPSDAIWDPGCGCLVVADSGPSATTLDFVNPTDYQVEFRAALPGRVESIAYDPHTNWLWTTLGGFFGTQGIDVLNATTGARVSLLSASWPGSVAVAPDLDRAFVLEGLYPANITVYNATSFALLGTIHASNSTNRLAYDPGSRTLFAADGSTDELAIVDPSTDAVSTVNVSGAATAVALDPVHGHLFVATGELSLASAKVVELATGNRTIVGTFSLSQPASGLLTGPSGDALLVATGSANVTVLNLTTDQTTEIPAGRSTTSFAGLPDGVVAAADPAGAVYLLGETAPTLLRDVQLQAVPGVVVLGGSVEFRANSSGGTGPLSYTYSGLPPGCIEANVSAVDCVPNQTGLFEVRVEVRDSAGAVADAATLVSVAASGTAYVLAFEETGLTNTSWGVSLAGGTPVTTGTALIEFLVPNGSYTFSIDPVSGHWVTPTAGTTSVAGHDVAVTVDYRLVTYAVEFTEDGLAAGLTWTVDFNRTDRSLTTDGGTDTLTFAAEGNGTYVYAISRVTDWLELSIPRSGNQSVAGSPLVVKVHYAAVVYLVSFDQTGLPSAVNWTLTLTAEVGSETVQVVRPASSLTRSGPANGSIAFSASNGSYTFVASAPGFSPDRGSLEVAGPPPSPETVTFVPAPNGTTGPGSGLPSWLLAAVGGAVTALVVLTAVLLLRRRRSGFRPGSDPSAPSGSAGETPPASYGAPAPSRALASPTLSTAPPPPPPPPTDVPSSPGPSPPGPVVAMPRSPPMREPGIRPSAVGGRPEPPQTIPKSPADPTPSASPPPARTAAAAPSRTPFAAPPPPRSPSTNGPSNAPTRRTAWRCPRCKTTNPPWAARCQVCTVGEPRT